ncbi:MAG: 2-phosphosulfolactate phosphatase [Ignavibacteriae bacterium]|nr:MAG: 2-phosphosulfolactate phosphatase [Ignavibacteriota bacterium]
MTKISLYFTHKHVESAVELKDKNVVVIDVLRTSTTMSIGLANGAKEIIPTEDVATAGLIGRNSQGQALLCGERNGKVIEGFNLGNSVKEYSVERVSGKTLIFNSTNGTPTIMKSKFAKMCVILGFANMTRVAEYLGELNDDFIILCAGKTGEFSLEDTVCGGMLIYKLIKKNSKDNYTLTDSARGALRLYSAYKSDLFKMLSDSEHGRFLASIGFKEDLLECAKVDVCNSLPLLRNGIIKLRETFDSDPKLTMKKVAQKSPNS